ncbi:14217_t:CDS:2, partial [Racocetra fulgida]
MNKPAKKQTKYQEDAEDEALQQLYQLCPDLNDQSVWFFSTLKKQKINVSNNISEAQLQQTSIGQIIKGKDYTPYFKNNEIVTLLSIKSILMKILNDDLELVGTNLMEGEKFLCLVSFDTNMKKELNIKEASRG